MDSTTKVTVQSGPTYYFVNAHAHAQHEPQLPWFNTGVTNPSVTIVSVPGGKIVVLRILAKTIRVLLPQNTKDTMLVTQSNRDISICLT